MAKRRSLKYRNKRAIYALLVKLSSHISQRFGIPAIHTGVDGSQDDTRLAALPPTLLTPLQAAKILGVTQKTLANWRVAGTSDLPHVSVGGRIRYRSSDVDNFIIRSRRTSTSDKGDKGVG